MLDFEFFYAWVKKNLNLNLDAYKETQLQRRISTVMRSSGAKTLEEYAELIKKDEQIRRVFLDYITINVTEFFRNKEIFDEFEKAIIDNLVPKHKSLKIWSAACSIGAEPYSIGILLDKHGLASTSKILATDIDDTILGKARIGRFKEHEIKNVEKKDLENYFIKEDKEFAIVDKIKKIVSFKKHDLLLDRYDRGFHAIVCRNVTIYFKNDAKDQIYKQIHESLVPGGIFFTGATESIYNPEQFGFRKLSTFIYEKI